MSFAAENAVFKRFHESTAVLARRHGGAQRPCDVSSLQEDRRQRRTVRADHPPLQVQPRHQSVQSSGVRAAVITSLAMLSTGRKFTSPSYSRSSAGWQCSEKTWAPAERSVARRKLSQDALDRATGSMPLSAQSQALWTFRKKRCVTRVRSQSRSLSAECRLKSGQCAVVLQRSQALCRRGLSVT